MRRFSLAVVFWSAGAGLALAHGDGLPIGPYELWHHWNFDPWVWAPLLLNHWLYGRGVMRAWARAGTGRIIPRWRVGCFAAGEAVLVAALISPLDPLGETLMSAHMAQHVLLTTIAPPLLVAGAPATAWTWAAPRRWRSLLAGKWARAARAISNVITRPFLALALHALAVWGWHAPAAFNAALADQTLHTLEHISFLGTGILLWIAVTRPATSPAIGALLILATFVHSGILGAVLTLAPAPLYAYGDRAMLWGMSPLADQQIAGLLMWAPAGLAYLAAFLAAAARIFPAPAPDRRASAGIMRASTSSRSIK